MTDIIQYLFTGALGAALVVAGKELLLWKLNRKAKLVDDDREEILEEIQTQLNDHKSSIERVTSILEQLESKIDVTMSSERVILKDRIKFVAVSYIRTKEISYEDKKALNEMWNIYHYGLGGNGDLDTIMKMIEDLPVTV